MATITVDDFPRKAEDALYTAIGLGVLSFQQVQVQRQQLKGSLAGGLEEACGLARDTWRRVNKRIARDHN
jgi:hypothetical protein